MKSTVKKLLLSILIVFCLLCAAGCTAPVPVPEKTPIVSAATDYPAAIMAEGVIWLLPGEPMAGEVDDSAILGYTASYTDTFPEKDGETNFDRETGKPYAKVEGGLAVLYQNEWYLCTPKK